MAGKTDKQQASEPFPEEGTPEYEAFINQQSEAVAVKEDRKVSMATTAGTSTLTPEELRALSLTDLAAMFPAVQATEAIGTDQYGPILKEKRSLVDVPFVIVHWEFHSAGKFGEFVSAWVMTKTGDRYIINDGSTGFYAQLRALTDEKGIDSMLVCDHGLRVSDYTKPINGVEIEASTFYIDTSL